LNPESKRLSSFSSSRFIYEKIYNFSSGTYFKQTWTPRVERARTQAVISYAGVNGHIPKILDKVEFLSR